MTEDPPDLPLGEGDGTGNDSEASGVDSAPAADGGTRVGDGDADVATSADVDADASADAEAPTGDDADDAGAETDRDPEPEAAAATEEVLDDVDVPESEEGEVEPVELLVTLAEDGEIDPWDIDIVEVTDAFLDELDRTDLRTSGRALFYASVLLRMKSDALLEAPQEESEPDPEPWEAPLEGGDPAGPAGADPIDALEREMDRRLERKSTRGSPETLDELVRELREAERGSWWKASRTYDTADSPRGYRRGTQTVDYHAGDGARREGEPGEEDVTGTTHTEDIERVIADVRSAVRSHYDAGRAEVLFREVRGAGGSAVMTYLAVLFLADRGAVRLQQDELFGDLWIRDPSAPAAGDEAVAD